AIAPAMVERGEGRIVVVSSMAKQMSSPGETAYAAAKAALSAYFESLATELWSSGVRFHLVYPALIELSGADGDDSLADTPNSGELVRAGARTGDDATGRARRARAVHAVQR